MGDHQMYVVLLNNYKRKRDLKSIIISRQPPLINFFNSLFYVCFNCVKPRFLHLYTPMFQHVFTGGKFPHLVAVTLWWFFFIQDKQMFFFLWTQVRRLSYTWIPIRQRTIIVQRKPLEHIDFIQKKEIKTWILHDIYK